MKQLIYILFLLVSFGQALFAQSVETELLEVRLLERMPFPLGKDWYQAQKEGWKAEVMKDKKDVRKTICLRVMPNIGKKWIHYRSRSWIKNATKLSEKCRSVCPIPDFVTSVCWIK